MLPEGWKSVRTSQLFEVQLGKMLNQIAKKGNEQRHYLTNVDIRWGTINTKFLNSMHFTRSERVKFALQFGTCLYVKEEKLDDAQFGQCPILSVIFKRHFIASDL